jgi:hypothetical protein
MNNNPNAPKPIDSISPISTPGANAIKTFRGYASRKPGPMAAPQPVQPPRPKGPGQGASAPMAAPSNPRTRQMTRKGDPSMASAGDYSYEPSRRGPGRV